jgi:DNA (cytosine-5)-methyltransferase 1
MRWTVVDLFSGAGGMSFGFHAHQGLRVASAVDTQRSKPSRNTLACNETYSQNIDIAPPEIDLQEIAPKELVRRVRLDGALRAPTALTSCPPCTGFSRKLPKNHKSDDSRNSLVGRVAEFTAALRPKALFLDARWQASGTCGFHCPEDHASPRRHHKKLAQTSSPSDLILRFSATR